MLKGQIGELRRERPSPEEFPKNAQIFDRNIWEAKQLLRQKTITHRDVSTMHDRTIDFALSLYAESP